MRFKYYCFIIIVFLSFSVLSQDHFIDSLKTQLAFSKDDNKIELLNHLSTYYRLLNDTLALGYSKESLRLSHQTNNKNLLAKSLYNLGLSYSLISDKDALKYLDKAESLSLTQNLDLITDIYLAKSGIYRRKGWFPQALNYGLKALDLFSKTKNLNTIAHITNQIAFTYDRMGNYKEAVNWNKKALKSAIISGNKKVIGMCLGGIGIAYDELKVFDSALYYNKKAVAIFEEIKDYSRTRTWYSNIGNTYSKLNKLNKAEEYTLKSLNIKGFKKRKSVTLVNLGKIYLETNRYKEAQFILDSALKNTLKYRQKRFESEAYYRFHELNLKLKNYKKAITFFKKYQVIEDSLMNSIKQGQIIDISTRYKTSERERELAEKNAELARETLKSKSRSLFAILLGSILIIVVIYSYFFRRQHKLDNLRIKEEYKLKDALTSVTTQNKLQEQRLRISRDLHDNIGSNLSFIISSIENLKYLTNPKNNKLLDKLSNIVTFSDDTISQLRDTIWAMNQNEISLASFEGRVLNFIDKAKTANNTIDFNFVNNTQTKIVFNAAQGINIYRIVQESINNTLKYAEASLVNIQLIMAEKNLEINISDNGKGFDIKEVQLGNGLNNIKKRADNLEAIVKIISKLNYGTTILLKIPLNTLNIVL